MTVAIRNTTPIPQPPARMIVGNLPEMRRKPTAVESLIDLAREYGEIFQLDLPLGRLIVASGPELVAELCDESRWDKALGQGLLLIRKGIGDGLFTAYTHEPNWQKAHNILMPTFSHQAMKAYVPSMLDIAEQLMESLEKAGDNEVDVPDEMTRLTLDTIGLCGFSVRFNSFHSKEMHPFVQAMMENLNGQQAIAARPQAISKLMIGEKRRMRAAQDLMKKTVQDIIDERRQSGQEGSDLLQFMLTGVDKKSGEGLPDTNIVAQCITFLVAGHETTSGLLSFAVHYLLKNPALLQRAHDEVDRVLGPDRKAQPTFEQINSLHFIEQVLKETLRLWPTAPAFNRAPEKDSLLGGRYEIPARQQVLVLIPALHRHPSVWPDPERFDPDRFLPNNEANRPANVFLPFGTGARACIGRQFAMQEAKLVLGMLLHRFDLVDFAHYQLKVKQSLTIKPKDFKIKVRKRIPAGTQVAAQAPAAAAPAAPQQAKANGVALQILYGSNLGAGEAFANELATEAGQRGFEAHAAPLDSAVKHVAREGALLVISSSYNGAPPDNAAEFYKWVRETDESLQGVRYSVFGCGNREWANTYQAVPRGLDTALEARGATRLLTRGEGDAQGDLDGDFRRWKAELWKRLAETFQLAAPEEARATAHFSVEVLEDVHPNPFAEAFQASAMVVVENRELQRTASGRSTRHLELALPEGLSYEAGDHLGVIPQNAPELVERVAGVFGLTPETRIRIHQQGSGKTALPIDKILSVGTVLTHYVELQETATRHQLQTAAGYCNDARQQAKLLALAEDEAYASLRSQGKSLVDLLEEFPGVALPFGHFLELVSPLRPRHYSISSAPVASGRLVSLTVGVVDAPARKGTGTYKGTCSNYLASLPRGQAVYAFIPDTHGSFRLPENPATPIIMIGAGTGLAPYRGFLQERAAEKKRGKAMLFFGCRHPEHDYLYQDELEKFVQDGVCQLVTAFSRHEKDKKVYVQDRLREHGDEIWTLLEQGAVVYVCGDAAGMAAGVRQALADVAKAKGAPGYLDQLTAEGRLRLDVWASS